MLVNLRGHRRKGEWIMCISYVCFFVVHMKVLSAVPLHCKQLSLSFWWRGESFSIVSSKQDKILLQFCSYC